ncbi:hypothetical protein ACN079_11885 [Pseudomonas sp. ABY48]|uniref:hypothetical protein n=1 Tax=Pseudomonas sp. ABY48 TaxID=3402865 RepID=UPI003B428CA5
MPDMGSGYRRGDKQYRTGSTSVQAEVGSVSKADLYLNNLAEQQRHISGSFQV